MFFITTRFSDETTIDKIIFKTNSPQEVFGERGKTKRYLNAEN